MSDSIGLFFVGIVLCLTGNSVQATPSKPKLSSFSAEVSVLGGGTQFDNVKLYANVEEKKLLQVVLFGNDPNTDVKGYTWEITHGNKTTEYDTINPFGYCVGNDFPADPTVYDIWFWLENATYTGPKQFTVHHVDTWSYEDKDEESFYQVGVSTTNPNQPVYFFSTDAVGVIVFKKYDSTPPASSVFAIPSNCKVVPPGKKELVYSRKNIFRAKY